MLVKHCVWLQMMSDGAREEGWVLVEQCPDEQLVMQETEISQPTCLCAQVSGSAVRANRFTQGVA